MMMARVGMAGATGRMGILHSAKEVESSFRGSGCSSNW